MFIYLCRMSSPKFKILHPHTSDSRTLNFGLGLANLKGKLRVSLFTFCPISTPILILSIIITIALVGTVACILHWLLNYTGKYQIDEESYSIYPHRNMKWHRRKPESESSTGSYPGYWKYKKARG